MVITRQGRGDVCFIALAKVCKAVSQDETRYFMNVLLVEEDWIVATNGRRLHFVSTLGFNIPPGKYTVEKLNQSKIILEEETRDIGIFPNWKRIVPRSFNAYMRWDSTRRDGFLYHPILKRVPLSHEYLKDITGCEYDVGFQVEPEKHGVFFVQVHDKVKFAALIMPFTEGAHILESDGKVVSSMVASVPFEKVEEGKA